ncbi:O-antigen ligase family protein [Hymenobacter fodinae]|uniref:O-antigen ligase family protein n=1 Tax=Hymenobacter fodinae TaxID=2510796 RepID=A0A4Z0PC45_9BACT|nr:O-antigen ligase family protein [Hymenobacter fodinae]
MPSSLSSQLTIPRILTASTVFCACIIVGLFTSTFFRILPSIGIVGVLLCGLVSFVLHRDAYTRSSKSVYLPFVLIYGIHAASGLLTNSANLREYERDIVLQLPFLALPIGFWLLPPIPTRQLRLLWYLLIVVTVISAAVSTGNYLLHVDEINELYLRSKVMPTEPDHIRFSLIVTLAIAVGAALLGQEKIEPGARFWLRMAIIGLALYQHLLAVRSGLVTFYVLGGFALLWLILYRKQYKRATGLAAALVLLPLFSYICFPTFRNKSANTREDVGRVDHTASANNYSLVGRVYSYKVALKVVEENPWFGVGKADMEQELAQHYKREFPNIQPEAYILPHNQFLFTTVALGCVGVVLFIIGFYYPGITSGTRYAPLLLTQYIIVTISFLVEYTIETQIGIAFSLFFLLLALEGAKGENSEYEGGLWRPC